MQPLKLPGTTESLKSIRDFVAQAATEAGLDKKAAYKLKLAVDEIAANAIEHGYRESGVEGPLMVSAVIDDDCFRIILEDEGAAYDPRTKEPPEDLDLLLHERQVGGLGIHLMNQGVDAFEWERVDGRNRNIFIMNRR